MKTIAHSNIATRFGAICALAVAGALLAGSITPAAAGKHGGGGGKHGNHQPQKPPQNPGPIGPVPKPTSQPSTPKSPVVVVVRDHRGPKATSGGGIKVTATPEVRDHRAQPVIRDHRAKAVAAKAAAGATKRNCVRGVCF